MRRRCLACFFALLVCVAFIISSCSSRNRIAGYICYRLSSNPTTLDPALIVDVTGGSISAKLYNGLVRIGDDLTIKPDIAEKWSVSKDGTAYTFSLRKGVKFSNKREVKAYDFKYSFERILHPKSRSPNIWIFENVLGADDFMDGRTADLQGLKVIDDYTIEIRLKRPFSPFLGLLTMTAAYVLPKEDADKLGDDFSVHPVGTGPFILKEWHPGREIMLERRDDYFGEKAKVKGILYRIIPEDLTAVTEFELGNIDVLTIPATEYSRYRNDYGKKALISSIKGLNTYYLGLNCSKHPFDKPALRKAISMAIDTQKILTTIYEGRGRLAAGPVPDALRTWGIEHLYEYNPGMARHIIREEGLDGLTIRFYVTAEQETVDIAEVIQSYIMAAGINVVIKQLEWSAYKEAVNTGEPDMFYLSWWADYPDPENFLYPLFHSVNHGPAGNRTRYSNPEVDVLIEKGRYTFNEKTRNDLYRSAEEIIVAEAPWVFLWHKTDFSIRQPWIKNYKNYSVYSMDKGVDIEILQ